MELFLYVKQMGAREGTFPFKNHKGVQKMFHAFLLILSVETEEFSWFDLLFVYSHGAEKMPKRPKIQHGVLVS